MSKRLKTTHNTVEAESKHDVINRILNDDCVLHIFEYLSFFDRITLEYVCRRWKSLSLMSWSSFKILNIDSTEIGDRDAVIHSYITDKVFRNMLRRCGPHLTTLDLRGFFHIGPKSIMTVIETCPKLKSFNLDNILFVCSCSGDEKVLIPPCTGMCLENREKAMEMLMTWNVLSQLKKFSISFASGNERINDIIPYQEYFNRLFSKFEKLEFLEIDPDSRCFEGRFFAEDVSFERLKGFSIIGCPHPDENLAAIIPAINRIQELRTFFIEDCTNPGIMIDSLVPHEKTLEIVGIDSMYFFEKKELKPILRFVNLRKFYIHCLNTIDDAFLAELVKHCTKLELVSLSGFVCKRREPLTDLGISELCKLPELKYLFLTMKKKMSRKVTGTAFRNLKNLKVLSCEGIKNLEDEGLSIAVSQSPELRFLNLAYCNRLTEKFYDTVLENVKQRRNNTPLKLRMYKCPNIKHRNQEEDARSSKLLKLFELDIHRVYFSAGDIFPLWNDY